MARRFARARVAWDGAITSAFYSQRAQWAEGATVTPIFRGRVRAGVLQVEEQGEYSRWLRSLGDCYVDVIVQEPFRRRTLPQNAYYAVLVNLMAEGTGHTSAELRTLLKRMFLPAGKRSTAQLSRVEMRRYLEHVIMLADWLEIRVAMPERVTSNDPAYWSAPRNASRDMEAVCRK